MPPPLEAIRVWLGPRLGLRKRSRVLTAGGIPHTSSKPVSERSLDSQSPGAQLGRNFRPPCLLTAPI